MKRLKSLWSWLVLRLLVYTAGLAVYLIFRFLERQGRIVVKREFRLPMLGKRPLTIAPNHRSMIEPFVAVAVFGPQYLRHPELIPWSTPDLKNFFSCFWFWLRPRAIMVPRGDLAGERRALKQMIALLKKNAAIVWFGEAGRTYSRGPWLTNEHGDQIRELKTTAGVLVRHTNTRVLPMWFSGTDLVMPRRKGQLFVWPNFRKAKIVVQIGSLLEVNPHDSREVITRKLSHSLLELAAKNHS